MNGGVRQLIAIGMLVWIATVLPGCAVAPLMHRGGIMVDSWAEVKADDKTVGEILGAFNRAEEALHAQNLDALMNLYSQHYGYHGLAKDDLRKVWTELFAQYQGFASNHIFSRITVMSGTNRTAEVTCTGSLWAISKETGHRVNLDSWYGEVHHLIYEDGAWRVQGQGGQAPKGIQFGVAPHPFF